MMREHNLKTWPAAFQAVLEGTKTYEVRRDDRDFQVGDVLVLSEYDPETDCYYSRQIRALVTYRTKGGNFGLPEGLCVMAIRVLDVSPTLFSRGIGTRRDDD